MLQEPIVTRFVRFLLAPNLTNDTNDYTIIQDGLMQLGKQEGIGGLSKGMVLALFGVSNGAIQFMAYEELKRWRVDARRNRLGPGTSEDDAKKLVNLNLSFGSLGPIVADRQF